MALWPLDPTPDFGYTNLRSHMQFQVVKSNCLCRQEHMFALVLLYQFLLGMVCINMCNVDFLYHAMSKVIPYILLIRSARNEGKCLGRKKYS